MYLQQYLSDSYDINQTTFFLSTMIFTKQMEKNALL